MKNNYDENFDYKNIQNAQNDIFNSNLKKYKSENNINTINKSEFNYYNTTNSFYPYKKNEINEKYNYYLSNFNKEKNIYNLNNKSQSELTFNNNVKNEQIEKLLEEEKNIEDENMKRLKELRIKYLSSIKSPDELNEIKSFNINEKDNNKLWHIKYGKNDLLNNANTDKTNIVNNNISSRNILDNSNNQIYNQFFSSTTNNEINLDLNNNKINSSNLTNNEINMSIYDRSIFQNKSEDFIKIPNYEQSNNNQIYKNYSILMSKYNRIKEDYDILKNEYINLLEKYNTEKNKNVNINNEKDAYDNYIIKQNEELKNINVNYEYILTPTINYINDINYILDKKNLKKLDLIKLKKNIKSLFSNDINKQNPLHPFVKLLQNYKDIIYNNEKIKNLNANDKNNKNKNSNKKLNTNESILCSYNIKENINNIKFKSLNTTKNKISKSITATPINSKNEKIKKIFGNRKNSNCYKSEKIELKNKINFIKSKNKLNSSNGKDKENSSAAKNKK